MAVKNRINKTTRFSHQRFFAVNACVLLISSLGLLATPCRSEWNFEKDAKEAKKNRSEATNPFPWIPGTGPFPITPSEKEASTTENYPLKPLSLSFTGPFPEGKKLLEKTVEEDWIKISGLSIHKHDKDRAKLQIVYGTPRIKLNREMCLLVTVTDRSDKKHVVQNSIMPTPFNPVLSNACSLGQIGLIGGLPLPVKPSEIKKIDVVFTIEKSSLYYPGCNEVK